MSAICPLGHTSDSEDYCDTCGSPMGSTAGGSASAGSAAAPTSAGGAATGAGAAGSGPEGAPPAPTTQQCPNCDTVNVADALFCEACGYDFTTGVMPRPIALADGSYLAPMEPRQPTEPAESADPDAPPETAVAPEAGATEGSDSTAAGPATDAAEPSADETPARSGESAGDSASPSVEAGVDDDEATESATESAVEAATEPDVASDVEAESSGPVVAPAPKTPAGETAAEAESSSHLATPAPAGPAAAAPSPSPSPSAGAGEAPSGKLAAYRPPSRETAKDWIVEVWIDPDWYAVQDSDEPCPSPGIPEIVALRDGALVGRPSASRRIHPDIDVGTDTGVSRRQALLSTDGHRWWVEDLDSSNGTFVGPASGPLPVDPIASRVEVDADDRIYVGAWTRLVVRPATDSERAGQG